jgi:DNA-binding transcriptional ArsR family regulator
MTEKEIDQQFKTTFKSLFSKLKNATLISGYPSEKKRKVDVALRLKIGEKKETLLCEVVSQSFPKQIREKGLQLLETSEQGKKGYPVIIAPYISELGKEICKKIGVGFLDLSGNAYLDFNSFYLEVEGKPNKFKSLGKLSGLFNPKGERVLRFYLLQGKDESMQSYRQIAAEVSVSLGQVSKVNKKLDELGLWTQELEGARVLDKTKLLDTWRDNYRFERNRVLNFYSMKQIPQIEKQIAEFCKADGIQYALTLFSGANRLAPFTRYNVATSYFSGDIERIRKELELKEVPSGANLQIIIPYDEGVYYKAQEVNSFIIANPIQIYLDLYNNKGRGREQAEFLRERIIKI